MEDGGFRVAILFFFTIIAFQVFQIPYASLHFDMRISRMVLFGIVGVICLQNSRFTNREYVFIIVMSLSLLTGFTHQTSFNPMIFPSVFMIIAGVAICSKMRTNRHKELIWFAIALTALLNAVAIILAKNDIYVWYEPGWWVYNKLTKTIHHGTYGSAELAQLAIKDTANEIVKRVQAPPGGFMGQSTMAAAYMSFGLPALLRDWRWWAGVPVVGYAIFVTGSAMGACCALIVFGVWLVCKLREYFFSLVFSAGVVAAIWWAWQDDPKKTLEVFFNDQHRYFVWEYYIRKWWYWSPWMGFGLGSTNRHLPYFLGEVGFPLKFMSAHNEYIQHLCEVGVIGTLVTIWCVLRGLKRAEISAWAGLLAFLFNCWGNFPLHYAPLAFIGIFYYAQCSRGVEDGIDS